jgi:hypothetical protein
MRVETRKKGSGEKGKYSSRLCCCCKTCWQMSVCPPRDCSSAINVCKKFFLWLESPHWWWRVGCGAQHRASFTEALVRIHDCHLWHRHFRIRALSSYDIQLSSRVYIIIPPRRQRLQTPESTPKSPELVKGVYSRV